MKRPLLHRSRPHSRLRPYVEFLEGRVLLSLTWSTGVALPAARGGASAVLAADQSTLELGGGITSAVELGLVATAWNTVGSIDQARVSPGVAALPGGTFLVFGGSVGGVATNTAVSYDPNNAANTLAVAPMSSARSLLAYAADGSGRIYAIGGLNASGTRLATVERFDPASGTWSAMASLPAGRSGASAVYDGAGHIYVFGGATSSGSRTNTALRYTVATNSWTTVASMSTSTTEAAAVMGPDGSIYVIGGKGSESVLSTVQVYNPATNKWSGGTALPAGVSDEAAVVDGQNRIEVIGGKNAVGTALASVYLTQSLANFMPQITSGATLPTATAGGAYAATVSAVGFPAPTFSITSGPAGLTIDPVTGQLTWTPTADEIGTQAVTVQAANAAGSTSLILSVTVTPDVTPPTAPSTATVGAVIPSSLSSLPLSWTASADNVGVAGYRLYDYTPPVYRVIHSPKGSGSTKILIAPAIYTLRMDNIATNSAIVTGLTPGAYYSFALAAFDAAGNQSGYSAPFTVQAYSLPSVTWSTNGGITNNPPLTVVANHSLYFQLTPTGNPAPTLAMTNAPAGVVFTPGQVTNSQLTFVIPNITWTPTADQVGLQYITMETVSAAGTVDTLIPVTVTPDLPVPTLSVNGGLVYTVGNMTSTASSASYQLTLNPGFDTSSGSHPQYAMVGNAFTFQFAGTSNTTPTTYALVSGPATMTIDPSSGAGSWMPTEADAGITSVTVSATNSAGASLLTFTFPTYFTTAPGNVRVNFGTTTSGAPPSTWTPVVAWTPPADDSNVAGYTVAVTNANTQVTTYYDSPGGGTMLTLPAGIAGQNFVTVTAYDAGGHAGQTSANGSLYTAALGSLSWTTSSSQLVTGQTLTVQFSGGAAPYTLVAGPNGATINSATGLVTWTPGASDVGTITFVVATANLGWGSVYATLQVNVSLAPLAAGVTSVASPPPVYAFAP